MKIRHVKRRSHIPTNSSLGKNETINFRPRLGNSDQLFKPYTADNLIKVYNTTAKGKESQMTKKSMKTSNVWDNSTKNTANESKMSVPQAQAAFKQIIKNKAKNNKKMLKIIKDKKQSIMPFTDEGYLKNLQETGPVRVSEPLPFSFSPRNSIALQSIDFSRQSDLLPPLNNSQQITPRVSQKSKIFVPLSKIQFNPQNTALLSSRA